MRRSLWSITSRGLERTGHGVHLPEIAPAVATDDSMHLELQSEPGPHGARLHGRDQLHELHAAEHQAASR